MNVGPIRAERLKDLLDRELPPNPSWIEPAILPKGGTLLLGGEAKIGKSLIMMEAGRALSTGTKLFGHPDFYTVQCKVLMIEAEVGIYGFQARSRTIFKGPDSNGYDDNFHYISEESRLQLDTQEGMGHFINLIETVRPNVIILDPISFMQSVNESDNVEVGKIFGKMNYLKSLCPEAHTSLIMSHHFKKPPDNPQILKDYDHLNFYNFRGAGKWYDGASSLLTMHRFKELKDVVNDGYEAWALKCRWKLRHGSSPPEMVLHCSEEDDLRCHWIKNQAKLRKLKIVPVSNVVEMPKPVQLDFEPV